jgi:SagB-type dehydrogenase family enzyme
MYELEFYLAVNTSDGLAPGLYHYDPQRHRLGRLATRTPEVAALLAGAGEATGIRPQNLQVLLILAARFQRLAWKYSGLAYALMLKHVGVVQQTMYLAATAMNLAPCAVGCGDPDLFARAAGTDYYGETSVGEFLLGSVPNQATKSSTVAKEDSKLTGERRKVKPQMNTDGHGLNRSRPIRVHPCSSVAKNPAASTKGLHGR